MVMNEACRCCLSEVCYKDISNEYVQNGCREVYAEMLMDTYNIEISYQGSSSRFICEECILRLRDAAAFKKQVIQVEAAITKGVAIGVVSDFKLKEEQDDFLDHITGEFEYEAGQLEDNDDHCFDNDNFDWPSENLDQNDKNMYLIKLDTEDDIPLQVLQKNKVHKKISQVSNIKKEKVVKKIVKSKTDAHRARNKNLPQSERKDNSLKLINNSNICLFDSMKTKYRCFYCKNSYLNIMELREHTLRHSNPSYLKMCINRLQGMSYKCADISNLTCRICSQVLKDLTDLRDHLAKQHDIKFTGEENMLIPYRLAEGFACVMCEQNFNTFYKLSVHMNTHYTNHVCEVCGASYINRLSLRMHVSSRHKESKCAHCPATFPNLYSRAKHLRKVHKFAESKRYCLLCNKTFRYTYMLEEHRIQEHGKKRAVSVCQECGKTFLSPVNLRTHIRCVHIKERNYPCTHCGMCFFTSCDKRRHERTHQDVRLFSCSYCDGRFKSKDSLRRHLKRQHGHLYNT